MTGRTHDLAAFTTLSFAFVYFPTPDISLFTLITALGANFIGGLFPDLDNASSNLWKKVRGGSILSRLISPLLGGHRMISHSLVGLMLTGFLLTHLLTALSKVLLVDMHVIWWSFMLGVVSHLATDALTKDGIPLLFPLPFQIGFPPFKFLRLQTGGRIEKSLVYPGLILTCGYLYFKNYSYVLDFLQNHLY